MKLTGTGAIGTVALAGLSWTFLLLIPFLKMQTNASH
jgi:hypothetical protein